MKISTIKSFLYKLFRIRRKLKANEVFDINMFKNNKENFEFIDFYLSKHCKVK